MKKLIAICLTLVLALCTLTSCGVIDSCLVELRGTDGLEFYLLPDGTYGVDSGTAMYLEEIKIPDTYKGKTVTKILDNAFAGAKNLKTITIPDSVTSIGNSAFSGCSSLTSITIPDGVTSIGNSAFYGCSSLTSITIPNGVTSIGVSAFRGCSSLIKVAIPDSVKSIGYLAFEACSSLASVTIGKGVTSIDEYAFYDCNNIVEVVNRSSLSITAGSSSNGAVALNALEVHQGTTKLENQDGYLFFNCKGVNYLVSYVGKDLDLVLPERYNGQKYVIYQKAFSNRAYLKSVIISSGVTSIGDLAFRGCSSLTSVTIPNSVMNIGYSAFSGCSSLDNVAIPYSVTRISDSAFYGCRKLKNISIPNSVSSIGAYAFYDCISLANITIPNSVISIGNSAFRGCSSLTSIIIPNSVTSIENYAFSGCSNLTSITIPDSVTSIGDSAFDGCGDLVIKDSYDNGVNTHLVKSSLKDVTTKAEENKLFTLTNSEVTLTEADYVRLQRPNRPVANDGATKLYGCETADYFALQKDAFTAFNALVTEFYKQKNNTKLWVKMAYNTQGGNMSYFSNALAVKLDYVTDTENYTTASIYGVKDYEWIYDHAHEYGFVRVSNLEGEENILRYVGLANAKYIQNQQKKSKDNFYSLESYLADIKARTPDTPIKISSAKKAIGESGTTAYYVYYMPADSAVVKLPTEKYAYTVMAIDGGYVVTYCKAETK